MAKGAAFTLTGEAIERLTYETFADAGEDFSFGLSPDNTVRDYLMTFYERVFEVIIGKDILDKTLGDDFEASVDEAFDKIGSCDGLSIFEQMN